MLMQELEKMISDTYQKHKMTKMSPRKCEDRRRATAAVPQPHGQRPDEEDCAFEKVYCTREGTRGKMPMEREKIGKMKVCCTTNVQEARCLAN